MLRVIFSALAPQLYGDDTVTAGTAAAPPHLAQNPNDNGNKTGPTMQATAGVAKPSKGTYT